MKRLQVIKISSPVPPAIFQSHTGTWYVISGSTWVEVPEGTTLDDVEWVRPVKAQKVRPTQVQLVPGSSGSRYRVALWPDGGASCECWGYRRWRKPCRHIKMARAA